MTTEIHDLGDRHIGPRPRFGERQPTCEILTAISWSSWSTRNVFEAHPRLCRSGERCTVRVHAFLRLPPPRWALSSPGPCPHQGSFHQKSGAMITIPPTSAPLEALLQRVREQYREMPGLQLTKPQATRLFGVAPSVCAAMLRALVMENFLSRAGDGLFVRSTTD